MKQNGFSLLELLVSMVVVGIILAVAIPSYTNYINRARLSEAFDLMGSYRLQMEQYYQDNANYGTGGNCALAVPTSDSFTYTCTLGANGQSFVLTATGAAAKNMSGYAFTIDSSGARRTTAFPDASVPANCWLSKAGGC